MSQRTRASVSLVRFCTRAAVAAVRCRGRDNEGLEGSAVSACETCRDSKESKARGENKGRGGKDDGYEGYEAMHQHLGDGAHGKRHVHDGVLDTIRPLRPKRGDVQLSRRERGAERRRETERSREKKSRG